MCKTCEGLGRIKKDIAPDFVDADIVTLKASTAFAKSKKKLMKELGIDADGADELLSRAL